MNFGKSIRLVRSARGLSQKELAALCSLDASYISLIEAGTRDPSAKTVKQIAQKLRVPENLIVLLAGGKKDLESLSQRDLSKFGKLLLELIIANRK